MKISEQSFATFQKAVLCLILFATTLALSACSGTVKDPQMEKFKKGIPEQREKEKNEPRLDVLVINKALKKGEVFKEDMLIKAKLPESKIPPGAIKESRMVIGKKAAYDVELGAIITGSYISP